MRVLPLAVLGGFAVFAVLTSAAGARADIGVITTVVEGFDAKVTAKRLDDLDDNVEGTLQSARVPLTLKCEPGTYDTPPDAKCVKDAVNAANRDIDEVAQVLLRSAGPNKTEMKLRIFGRDGVVLQQPTEEIVDVQAAEVTTAMLRKAFDPSRFSGRASIQGAPGDAELLVDGLRVEGNEVTLRVGPHVLDVVHANGAVETVPFVVELDQTEPVLVPSAPVAAASGGGAPFIVSATTASVGVAAAVGAVILFIVANDNAAEWHRRAVGRTFPRNSDDPRCAATECRGANGAQIGWTEGYGPLGDNAQVGQGARFMMVAFSRDNELRWASSREASIGLAIAGAAALVGGAVATFALWPSDPAAPPTTE
jgi:hypothetical protein